MRKYLDPFLAAVVAWLTSTVWIVTLGRYCPPWETQWAVYLYSKRRKP